MLPFLKTMVEDEDGEWEEENDIINSCRYIDEGILSGEKTMHEWWYVRAD